MNSYKTTLLINKKNILITILLLILILSIITLTYLYKNPKIPVLCYHNIATQDEKANYPEESDWTITTDNFKEHLDYLKNNNYSNLDQKHSGNANNDFQTYAQNLFDEQLLSDSLSMHFYIKTPDKNIRNSPVTLGDFSYDSMVKSQQYYINQINLLKDFNYKKLSQKEQLTYDVLLDYFRNQLDYGDLCLCNPVLSPTTGIQAQLPILFAEYTFADKKDIDNYLTLVSQINDFFNNYYSLIYKNKFIYIIM